MANTSLRSRFEVGEPLTQLLRRHRSRLDKSQADIARDAWLDESYVSRLFQGRKNPSRDALVLWEFSGLGSAWRVRINSCGGGLQASSVTQEAPGKREGWLVSPPSVRYGSHQANPIANLYVLGVCIESLL